MRRRRWVAVGIGAVGLGWGLGTASQAATSPGLVYSGNTSQKVPMYIRLNLARTKIASTSWRWNAPCTLGSAATADTSPALRGSEVPWTNIPVSSTGAWKIAVTQRWVYGTTHYVGTYRVYGKRVGDTMQGTIKATLVERNSAGALIATCISPLIRFSLGNTRRYGGPSGQGRPMAASLSVDRRKARLDWSWKAKCTGWTGSTSRTYIEGVRQVHLRHSCFVHRCLEVGCVHQPRLCGRRHPLPVVVHVDRPDTRKLGDWCVQWDAQRV